MLTATQAKQKLMEGNRKYLEAETGQGDIPEPSTMLKMEPWSFWMTLIVWSSGG